jgi:hypothetical protein
MPSGSGGHADAEAGGGIGGASAGVAAMQRTAGARILPEGDAGAAEGATPGGVAALSLVMGGPFVVDAGAGSGGVRLQAAMTPASAIRARTRAWLIARDSRTTRR